MEDGGKIWLSSGTRELLAQETFNIWETAQSPAPFLALGPESGNDIDAGGSKFKVVGDKNKEEENHYRCEYKRLHYKLQSYLVIKYFHFMIINIL